MLNPWFVSVFSVVSDGLSFTETWWFHWRGQILGTQKQRYTLSSACVLLGAKFGRAQLKMLSLGNNFETSWNMTDNILCLLCISSTKLILWLKCERVILVPITRDCCKKPHLPFHGLLASQLVCKQCGAKVHFTHWHSLTTTDF